MPLPKFLQSCLWSYDISKMNPRNSDDKELIIQQVLNHGDWHDLKWLFKTYPQKDIVRIVKNPKRGLWFKNVLDYWLYIFGLKIAKNKYQWALFNLNPRPNVFRNYFKLSQKKNI